MKSHQESILQRVCVAKFRAGWPQYEKLFFAVPNGGGRSRTEAAILKGEGVTAGVADTLLLVPNKDYHGLCIEFKCIKTYVEDGKFKKRNTYQEPEQKAWQKEVEKVGYRYAVVRTEEEFFGLIKEYLKEEPKR